MRPTIVVGVHSPTFTPEHTKTKQQDGYTDLLHVDGLSCYIILDGLQHAEGPAFSPTAFPVKDLR